LRKLIYVLGTVFDNEILEVQVKEYLIKLVLYMGYGNVAFKFKNSPFRNFLRLKLETLKEKRRWH